MSTSNIDIVKSHIEEYLAKGIEKLDVSKLLRKSSKYPGAITSYIDAYEEIGQAVFIADKISLNEEITEEDWNKYIKPANHQNKILNHWITRKNHFKNSSNEDFEQIQKSGIGELFPINDSRTDVIEKINTRISIIKKLHEIRQTFDYSHNLNGQITNKVYDEQTLEAFCHFLESECLTSYYTVKQVLESLSKLSPHETNEIALSKIISFESTKKLIELIHKNNSSTSKNLRKKALEFIDSF